MHTRKRGYTLEEQSRSHPVASFIPRENTRPGPVYIRNVVHRSSSAEQSSSRSLHQTKFGFANDHCAKLKRIAYEINLRAVYTYIRTKSFASPRLCNRWMKDGISTTRAWLRFRYKFYYPVRDETRNRVLDYLHVSSLIKFYR